MVLKTRYGMLLVSFGDIFQRQIRIAAVAFQDGFGYSQGHDCIVCKKAFIMKKFKILASVIVPFKTGAYDISDYLFSFSSFFLFSSFCLSACLSSSSLRVVTLLAVLYLSIMVSMAIANPTSSVGIPI